MPEPSWIRVRGDRLVDESGTTVVLAGYGLGGWMNMENFITGYPSTESLQRKALRNALGEEGYRRFFEAFLDDFFGPDDAAYLASLGLNALRVPLNYRHFESDDAPFEIIEAGFAPLDRLIDRCAAHGIYTILDLHALPGSQNQHWHSDNPTHWAHFWTHRHFQDRVVHLWEAIATRYAGRPEVAGYNLVNEPADATGAVIGPFYQRLERAIRAIDPKHVLFLDGNRYATDFSVFDDPFENTVYSAHDYALPGIAHGATYPGTVRGQHFVRATIEQTFLHRTEFMRSTGTPIWIGEFGPVYTGDADIDAMRYRLLRDQLEIYAEHGASWSLWTYKDIGLQGLVYTAPDCGYLQRIAPVLAKKARLGADSWGADDSNVRYLLDPIDKLFDEEFPNFDPFPWGRKSWVATLVRNILFAEPLVGEFGRCFTGVTPEEAERLAADFAFANCVPRTGLAEILKEHRGG
ncbi:MAG TPA: cellulase family glycosylhydrolase [Actinophytocola sp.]|jgi:hypothetical protein|uniref:glycoside hydrolase family 5 protein n=1 Tax=Actinophytocola sp. TaxID=1872138 RepID=UPI002E03E614|nr:cellulase family glycosylhydrolase [Actinophytocola sp.]